LSAGHGRILIGLPNADSLADEIVAQGLNVRRAEDWVRMVAKMPVAPANIPPRPKSADVKALEKRVSDALGLHVRIDALGVTGTMHIVYGNLDQLDLLIRRLESDG